MGLELPVFRQPYAQEKLVRKLALKKKLKKGGQRGLFLGKSKGIDEQPTSCK
jgi:hypothetical protein